MYISTTMKSFKLRFILLVVGTLLAFSGCTIKLVDDYDAITYEEIIRVGREVDKFYGQLLEDDEANRSYQKFSEKYVDLETELRSLYIRNKSRPLNEESTAISASTLQLWLKYKEKHEKKNTYPSGAAVLDRKRFVRLFLAAASAEAAKKLDPDDVDSTQESKNDAE